MDDASYERLRSDHHAENVLRALGTMKTLMFIGCGDGLSDPNFSPLLQWMRELFAESMHDHFRLCCKGEERNADSQIRDIPYGADHSALASFLCSLIPTSSSSAHPISTPTPAAPSIPQERPHYGREEEIHRLVATVCSELPASIPVLGPPGIGKTTITLAALHAAQVLQRFRERRYFAYCDGAMSSEGLLGEISRALHLKPGLEPKAQVLGELASAPALLVLDNLETPWERDRQSTENLLAEITNLSTLALIASLRGEQRPQGLHWCKPIKVHPLDPSPARQAFLDVAGKQEFQEDPLLDSLLKAVDYLPLAIFLLACQAEGEPNLESLWQRWQQEKTKLLKRPGGRDRENNLEVSLGLSISSPRMDEAGPSARRLMALLGFLPEGIAPDNLRALFPKVGDAAASTLRKVGLTVRDDPRSRMYVPIREYVRAEHRPQKDDLKRAIGHFLGLLKKKENWNRLEAELGNLEAVILKALDHHNPVPGIEAALTLSQLSFATESCQIVLPKALKRAKVIQDSGLTARVLVELGEASIKRSKNKDARIPFQEALLLFQQIADVQGQGHCMRKLAEIDFRRTEHDSAKTLYEEAVPLLRSVDDVLGEAYCELGLGEIALDHSDPATALTHFEKALPLFRSVDSGIGVAHCTRLLGVIALDRCDHITARARFGEALAGYRGVGEVMGEANCITALGEIALAESDYDTALLRFEEAIPLYQRLDRLLGVGNCTRKLGEVALLQGNYHIAHQRFEEALRLYSKDEAESVFGRAHCFRGLGDIAAEQSEFAEAIDFYKKSLVLFEKIPNPEFIGKLRERLARISLQAEDSQPKTPTPTSRTSSRRRAKKQ